MKLSDFCRIYNNAASDELVQEMLDLFESDKDSNISDQLVFYGLRKHSGSIC